MIKPAARLFAPLMALGVFAHAAMAEDVLWASHIEPLLKERGAERVFYEIESPLVPVLADMELEGIKLDAATLNEFSDQLTRQIADLEKTLRESDKSKRVEFYTHDEGWKNKVIR